MNAPKLLSRTAIMIRKRTFIILFACLAAAADGALPAAGDTTPPGALGLRETIALALESNNRYRIAHEKVRESNLKVREVWGKLWPDLSSAASGTRVGADKGMLSLTNGQYNLKFVRCAISVNPGAFYNGLKASQDGYVSSVNEERRVKADTIIQTIRLYYRIQLASEIIKLRTDSIRALEENLRVVTTGYRAGSFTRLDFLRAKVAAANEKTRLIIAKNDYQSAVAAMNIHLGREIDSRLELDPSAITAAGAEESDIAGWSDDEQKKRVTAMVAESMKNRPELIQVQSKKQALAHGAALEESLYMWPTVFVSGEYGMTKLMLKDPGGSTGDASADLALAALGKTLSPEGWYRSWMVTAGATYRWGGYSPLDQGHAKADQLRSRERQTDLEMEDLVRDVKLEVQHGLLKLVSSSNAILSQKENIESAEESLRVAIIQFKNGVIDNTKLLDANVELTSARSMYIQALYDYQTSKAELNRAIGRDYFTF